MKKTTLLSIVLAIASTSVAFGADHFYKVEVSNQSPYNIEAIETFIAAGLLPNGQHFVSPWAGIVSGLSSGGNEYITVSEMTDRFPFIQVNGVVYELSHANGKPVHFKKGDRITFFDNRGTLGARYNHEQLNISPVFEGTYLEHINALPTTANPVPAESMRGYRGTLGY